MSNASPFFFVWLCVFMIMWRTALEGGLFLGVISRYWNSMKRAYLLIFPTACHSLHPEHQNNSPIPLLPLFATLWPKYIIYDGCFASEMMLISAAGWLIIRIQGILLFLKDKRAKWWSCFTEWKQWLVRLTYVVFGLYVFMIVSL